MLFQVRRESKDHATLSDLYLNNVITRLTHISEDSARLLKRVSENTRCAIWTLKYGFVETQCLPTNIRCH